MGTLVEVDSDELSNFKAAYDLQNTLFNGKSKRSYEKVLKEQFGDKIQTTDDLAATYTAPIRKELDELKAKERKREEDVQDAELKAAFDRLKSERQFTDEGIQAIQRIMIEKKIPDVEAAADHWERKNPPKVAESNGFRDTGWNFDEKDSEADQWFANPDRMFNKVAAETIQQVRTSARK
jgi:hypothetical protein